MAEKKPRRTSGAGQDAHCRQETEIVNQLIENASAIISERLGVERASVDWTWRYIDRAGNRPGSSAEDRALFLAQFLVAVLGSNRPADAAEVVGLLEGAPLIRLRTSMHTDAGLTQSVAPPAPDDHPISQSVVLAIAWCIASVAVNPDIEDHALPDRIRIVRNLVHPCATFSRPPSPQDTFSSVEYIYGAPDFPAGYDELNRSLQVEARAPGSIIRALGDLLGNRDAEYRRPPLVATDLAVMEPRHHA